jgi:hypothetical protein
MSWRKKEVKENNPKRTPKIIMPLIGVHKLNKNENPESNPKIDQAAYLQN